MPHVLPVSISVFLLGYSVQFCKMVKLINRYTWDLYVLFHTTVYELSTIIYNVYNDLKVKMCNLKKTF